MNNKLKLFVFEGLQQDNPDGLAFAIAETLEEAKEMIKENEGFYVTEKVILTKIEDIYWGKLHIHELNEKVAYSMYGGG